MHCGCVWRQIATGLRLNATRIADSNAKGPNLRTLLLWHLAISGWPARCVCLQSFMNYWHRNFAKRFWQKIPGWVRGLIRGQLVGSVRQIACNMMQRQWHWHRIFSRCILAALRIASTVTDWITIYCQRVNYHLVSEWITSTLTKWITSTVISVII